jgi:hypothetical protein
MFIASIPLSDFDKCRKKIILVFHNFTSSTSLHTCIVVGVPISLNVKFRHSTCNLKHFVVNCVTTNSTSTESTIIGRIEGFLLVFNSDILLSTTGKQYLTDYRMSTN